MAEFLTRYAQEAIGLAVTAGIDVLDDRRGQFGDRNFAQVRRKREVMHEVDDRVVAQAKGSGLDVCPQVAMVGEPLRLGDLQRGLGRVRSTSPAGVLVGWMTKTKSLGDTTV